MLPIAILIPQNYWNRTFRSGNAPGHRSLPDILAALRQAGARVARHPDEIAEIVAANLAAG